MTNVINPDRLEFMFSRLQGFAFSLEQDQHLVEKREAFTKLFDRDKIRNLEEKDYFPGKGAKESVGYQLEWGTMELGSIRGGSSVKYGYPKDFPRIKELLEDLTAFDDDLGSFYTEDGDLSEKARLLCNKSRQIKGLTTCIATGNLHRLRLRRFLGSTRAALGWPYHARLVAHEVLCRFPPS